MDAKHYLTNDDGFTFFEVHPDQHERFSSRVYRRSGRQRLESVSNSRQDSSMTSLALAFVTGTGWGIGTAIAMTLTQDGFDITLANRAAQDYSYGNRL